MLSNLLSLWKPVVRVGRRFLLPRALPRPARPPAAAAPRRRGSARSFAAPARAKDKQLPRWKLLVPTAADPEAYRVVTERARTKSEARGRAKKALGLSRKERLPIGTWIERLKPRRKAIAR